MIIKLNIPYETITSRLPTYPLPKGGGVMIACPRCTGRIVIHPSPEGSHSCVLDTACECDVEAAMIELMPDLIPSLVRKRRRRKYLANKADTFFSLSLGSSALLTALVVMIACFVGVGQIQIAFDRSSEIASRVGHTRVVDIQYDPIEVLGLSVLNAEAENTALILALLGLCSATATFGVWRWVRDTTQQEKIPYIPPVIVEHLPAKEVLVRGAEQPSIAQSEMLLRAAKTIDTPQEELLRVSQGEQS